MIGNAIACGYSVLSLPFAAHMVEGWMLNLFDLVMLNSMFPITFNVIRSLRDLLVI